ncbi:MAG: hypothetical protein VKP62_09705 [Candidatus Sericytochromatia bacterium]|nr:hypothetical protein [Candidatus Sericytochromatia bacterium]
MRRCIVTLGFVSLLLGVAACAEESPTGTGVSTANASEAPQLAGIDLVNQGDRFVLLTARATDPRNRALSFRWQVNGGDLSQTTGRSVSWRVPAAAGTYTALVEVDNGTGNKVAGNQSFTVNPQGQVANQGGISLQPVSLSVRNAQAAGAFALPSPLNVAPNPPIVPLNPNAVPASPSPTAAPFQQPVSTPVPAPAILVPPLQPIAAPTLTPPPQILPPSPRPVASPPPPQPDVPVPPAENWFLYAPSKIPVRPNWYCLHLPKNERGWFGGGTGSVLFYDATKGTEKDPPTLELRNTGIGTADVLQIHFVSDSVGFVACGDGSVLRTKDEGRTWEQIGPREIPGKITAMVVTNEQKITFCDFLGNCFRTESANLTDASGVRNSWVKQPTFPADRPFDWPKKIAAGTGLTGDSTVFYFVGDGIFKLDVDHPTPALRWRRVQTLTVGGPAVETEPVLKGDVGDGEASAISHVDANGLWIGTTGGTLYRSSNAQSDTPTFTRSKAYLYRNREANGNGAYFEVSSISDISAVDTNNVFLSSRRVYDTKDGGQTWRRDDLSPQTISAFQINYDLTATPPRFRGFGVGANGDIWQYR